MSVNCRISVVDPKIQRTKEFAEYVHSFYHEFDSPPRVGDLMSLSQGEDRPLKMARVVDVMWDVFNSMDTRETLATVQIRVELQGDCKWKE